jgi:preprotein translocase subunit SecG
MTAVILVIHIILAIAMILIVLIQQSEGGMGGLGGGGGMGGFMTGRATANLLTRATAILAGLFFLTSLGLAILADQNHRPASILDVAPSANQGSAPAQPAPQQAPAPPSQ